jgi:hypothetical protein
MRKLNKKLKKFIVTSLQKSYCCKDIQNDNITLKKRNMANSLISMLIYLPVYSLILNGKLLIFIKLGCVYRRICCISSAANANKISNFEINMKESTRISRSAGTAERYYSDKIIISEYLQSYGMNLEESKIICAKAVDEITNTNNNVDQNYFVSGIMQAFAKN